MFCGYTCSADPAHKQAMEARRALAAWDRTAWLATFDQHDRYLDPKSGFWESLNGELYLPESKSWVAAYDGDDNESLAITIVAADPAPASAIPNHLMPGAGSSARFRVSSGPIPTRAVMSEYLERVVVDANLMSYDESTGEGYFVVVDGDAPVAGTVINLSDAPQSDPIEPARAAAATDHLTMTIEEFYDELNRHDWYCGFSDDYSVERQGDQNYKRLLQIAEQHGQDYQLLCRAFEEHYFSGEPWGKPKRDKPSRPINGVLVLPPAPAAAEPPKEQDDIRKLLRLVGELPLDAHQELSEPTVDSRAAGGALLSDELLCFRDKVIEDTLTRLVSGKYFDICTLGRAAEAIDARLGRQPRPYGEKTPVQAAIGPTLDALHCVHFDKMAAPVRAALPKALMAYLDLDDAIGEQMLGQEAWGRVADAYRALAVPVSVPATAQPSEPDLSVLRDFTPPGAVRRHGIVRRVLTHIFGRHE